MDFLILNRGQVGKISLDVPHVVISICEPEKKFPHIKGWWNKNPNLLGIIRLKYTDEDSPADAIRVGQEHYLFTDEQADKVLDFIENMKDRVELIICQCDGGISRSSGTAAALSVILNGSRSDNWIFNSPQYVPNMFVYRKLLSRWVDRMEVNDE